MTASAILRFLWKSLSRLVAGLLALALLAVAVLLVLGFTAFGNRFLASQVARMASSPELGVTIEGGQGLLQGALRLDKVTLSDDRGPFVEISGLAVDWSPLALLSGRFEATRIRAETVEVSRLSQGSQTSSDQSSSFALPVEIEIDQLDLPQLRLGKDIARRETELSLSGSARAVSDRIFLDLQAREKARPSAFVKAKIDYAVNSATLAVDGRLSEPAGGLLATTLRLPNTPPVEIDVTGKGPLDAWSGKLLARLAGRDTLSLAFAHSIDKAGLRQITASGGGAFGELMPPTLSGAFAGQSNLDLDLGFAPDGRLDIRNARLANAGLVFDARGQIDPQGRADVTASLEAAKGRIDLAWPIENPNNRLGITSADIRLAGDYRAARLDLDLKLAELVSPDVNLGNVAVAIRGPAIDLATGNGVYDSKLSADGLQLGDKNAGRLLQGPLALTGRIVKTDDSYGLESLEWQSPKFGGNFSGAFSASTKALSGKLKVFALADGLMPADIAARFDGTIGLAATIDGVVPDRIDLTEARLTSNLVNASGEIHYDATAIRADLVGTVADLGKLVAGADGTLDFQIKSDGALPALPVSGRVQSRAVTLAGSEFENLALDFAAIVDPANPTVSISAATTFTGQPLKARAELGFKNDRLVIPALSVEQAGNRIEGSLLFSGAMLPSGVLTFDMPDMASLGALAGVAAKGDLKGNLTLSDTEGKLSAALKASGAALDLPGANVTAPQLDIALADLPEGRLSGKLAAGQIALGSETIGAPTIRLSGTALAPAFDLAAIFDAAPLLASGHIARSGSDLAVVLQSASASPRKIPLSLSAPTTISIRAGAARVQALKLAVDSGMISIDGSAGAALDLKAVLADLPVDIANRFDDTIGAEGLVSGHITIKGQTAAPNVDFDLAARNVTTAALKANGLEPFAIQASGTMAGQVVEIKAQAQNDQALTIETRGTIGLAAGTPLALDVSGKVPLALAASRAKMDALALGGLGLVDLKIRGPVAKPIVTGTLGTEGATAQEGRPVVLTGRLKAELPDRLTLTDLAFSTDLASASGRIDYGEGEVSATLSGTLPDVAPFLANAKGRADFTLAAKGPIAALPATVTLTMADATLAGRAVKELAVTVKALADPVNPSGTVRATGQIDGQIVDVTGNVARNDGRIVVPQLAATIGANRLSGAITLDENLLPNGRLSFDLPDIGLMAALAAQQAKGDLKGEIAIQARNGTVGATVRASGTMVQTSGVAIKSPAVDLTIADLATGAINGTLKAASLVAGTASATDLGLVFDLAGNRTGFDLKANYDAAPLTAKGAIMRGSDGLSIELDSFSARPRKIPVRLSAPVSIAVADGAATIDGLVIELGKGRATLSGKAGPALDLDVKIAALPANLVNTFADGLGADGTISATIRARGTTASPDVSFETNWQNAAIGQTRANGIKPLAITAKGNLKGAALTLDVSARNADGLRFATRGTVNLAKGPSLDLQLDGQVPFAAAANQLAVQGIDLKGNATLALAISGPAANPSINGSISAKGATLTLVRQNLIVNDIAATVTLSGKQATISGLRGKLAGGGTVDISGTVGYAAGAGFPANLKIGLKDAVYMDGKVVVAKMSGDLTVEGRLIDNPALEGRIRLQRADITIPEKLPASLAKVKVSHKNAPAEVAAQAREIRADHQSEAGKKAGGGIRLSLKINAPRRIFVRGRGLDAELGGDVTITGTSASPSVAGAFSMQRGRLALVGKRLDFSSGTISFAGGMMPTLNMVATSTVNATSVTVTVSGLANNPNFVFSSSPALPQDEVLALLIFGRTSTSLSPVQIALLADAVATLSGGQSNSLLNKLRQGLGVDNLDVGTDESGKANVTAGKYLNKRTYLELKQGADNNSKAVINLDIGKGVKLRGEAGSDGSNAAGIFYEKEY